MKEEHLRVVGWIASITAILMFVSYADQIRLNLSGHPGSVWQPAATVLNCVLWTTYALARPRKDWPIAAANIPGIALGLAALVTAIRPA
ncbi:hypothetical protein WNB94_01330 [Aquabacterium sp. A3]|uniref:hypothetical protein n=1 Tax=Aquabacterium sp. A3 TaxID=3132829 RepID=UPI00311A1B75